MKKKYLEPRQFKHPLEYVASRTIQLACEDYVKWTDEKASILNLINDGINVKRNKAKLDNLNKELKDIENFFKSETSGVYGALSVDGEAILQWLRSSLGLSNVNNSEVVVVPSSAVDTSSAVEEAKEIVLPYKIVEVENGRHKFEKGQYKFVFLEV